MSDAGSKKRNALALMVAAAFMLSLACCAAWWAQEVWGEAEADTWGEGLVAMVVGIAGIAAFSIFGVAYFTITESLFGED